MDVNVKGDGEVDVEGEIDIDVVAAFRIHSSKVCRGNMPSILAHELADLRMGRGREKEKIRFKMVPTA
jgi:hypothetical protein